MTITLLLDPQVHAMRARIRELEALRTRVTNEINDLRDRLASHHARHRDLEAFDRPQHIYRPRGRRPACGTEQGYQWHREHDRENWPLPADDPCGCKGAHAAHNRHRDHARREARQDGG